MSVHTSAPYEQEAYLMSTIRPMRLPADQRGILQLDTSFTTERIYRVNATATSFTLSEEAVQPIQKAFALDREFDDDRMWEYGLVAEDQDTLVGFAAVRLEQWN